MNPVLRIIIIIISIFSIPFLMILLIPSFFSFLNTIYYGNPADLEDTAIKNNDPSLCSRINVIRFESGSGSIRMRRICVNKVAVQNKNPEACNYLNVEGYSGLKERKNCYIESGASLTKENIIKKYCLNLEPQMRGECLGFLAGNIGDKGDISICDESNNNTIKAYCYRIFVGTAKIVYADTCKRISGDDRDYCFASMAPHVANLSLCDLIVNTDIKKYCKEETTRTIKIIEYSK